MASAVPKQGHWSLPAIPPQSNTAGTRTDWLRALRVVLEDRKVPCSLPFGKCFIEASVMLERMTEAIKDLHPCLPTASLIDPRYSARFKQVTTKVAKIALAHFNGGLTPEGGPSADSEEAAVRCLIEELRMDADNRVSLMQDVHGICPKDTDSYSHKFVPLERSLMKYLEHSPQGEITFEDFLLDAVQKECTVMLRYVNWLGNINFKENLIRDLQLLLARSRERVTKEPGDSEKIFRLERMLEALAQSTGVPFNLLDVNFKDSDGTSWYAILANLTKLFLLFSGCLQNVRWEPTPSGAQVLCDAIKNSPNKCVLVSGWFTAPGTQQVSNTKLLRSGEEVPVFEYNADCFMKCQFVHSVLVIDVQQLENTWKVYFIDLIAPDNRVQVMNYNLFIKLVRPYAVPEANFMPAYGVALPPPGYQVPTVNGRADIFAPLPEEK